MACRVGVFVEGADEAIAFRLTPLAGALTALGQLGGDVLVPAANEESLRGNGERRAGA